MLNAQTQGLETKKRMKSNIKELYQRLKLPCPSVEDYWNDCKQFADEELADGRVKTTGEICQK